MERPTISRKEAVAKKLTKYFTGKPCKRGHVAERKLPSGTCTECYKQYDSIRSASDKRRNKNKQYHVNKKLQTFEPVRPMPERCELCGSPPEENRGLNLDHDHQTGKFRGWLCFKCNTGIGKLGDSVVGLEKALKYLRDNTDATTVLPTDAAARKRIPLGSGLFDYFPAALVEIAKVSFIGNEQHNPGQPVHWNRSKSADQIDTLLRHLTERGSIDVDGVRHSAKMAWRALALLQLELEEAGAPMARNATEGS